MTLLPRVQSRMRRAIAPMLAALIVLLPAAAFPRQQRENVNPQAAALQEFQNRLNAYLKLREEFGRRLGSLSPTASSAELTARQESLAAALKTARKTAKQGDLIPAPVAALIAKIVVEDFHLRNPQLKQATLEEVPIRARPVINRTYPADAALPTVPPLLLKKLPLLPDNLQYRFFGRHVVILDGDTQIIVDYIADVLPPH